MFANKYIAVIGVDVLRERHIVMLLGLVYHFSLEIVACTLTIISDPGQTLFPALYPFFSFALEYNIQ